jgi:hypothetical protein
VRTELRLSKAPGIRDRSQAGVPLEGRNHEVTRAHGMGALGPSSLASRGSQLGRGVHEGAVSPQWGPDSLGGAGGGAALRSD